MSEPQEIDFLDFNVKVLKFMTLWPNEESLRTSWSFIKYYLFLLALCPSSVPVAVDMVMQLQELEELIGITENIVGLAAWVGMMYMSGCFMKNRDQMKELVRALQDFHKYGDRNFVVETHARATLISKFFLIYGIMGNLCYASIPIIQRSSCDAHVKMMDQQEAKYVICGLITRTRLPFDISSSPRTEIMFVIQMLTCISMTVTVLAITMFLCSLLLHVVSEIKNLQVMMQEVCARGLSDQDMQQRLGVCVEYHRLIILYSDKMRDAFSSMMLVHLTLTSLVISVLGYEVLMVKTPADSLRFSLHLGGWLLILLLTCYFGQQLIDESSQIGWKIYCSDWFNGSSRLRKDIRFIIMRSANPLALTAASMGVMSLETFLRVMSTAYSYFTLLINMKS